MFEFDLQRFDEESAAEQATSVEAPQQQAKEEQLPEELNGLPEDIARETFNEWKATQASEQARGEQPAQQQAPKTEESVPYARFKEKVDEANQLKAQLAEYQRNMQQRQFVPQQPPVQPQQTARQQARITPEIAKKINEIVDERAMKLSGLTPKEVEELDFVDNGDIKLEQWKQSKAIARDQIFGEIRQAQFAQLQRQQQAQEYLAIQRASMRAYYDYVQKESATLPNYTDIQNFAANEYFEQLPPAAKNLVATSYLHAEQNIATPAELYVVQSHYEMAKAAFTQRANAAKKQVNTPAQRPAGLPRVDNLKGASSQSDGQLSTAEIEKLLQGDFTKIDPKTQRLMLGLT